MRLRLGSILAGLASMSLLISITATVPAQAAVRPDIGTNSLQAFFTADGDQFDTKWNDFDVATEITAKVLSAKPGSALKAVTNGNVALTAFVPTDRAFRKFVRDLTGVRVATEQATFDALVNHATVDQLEKLMLSQIVPNATLRVKKLRAMNGAVLSTMSGSRIRIKAFTGRFHRVVIADQDRNDQNAWILPFKRNLNRGNLQLAQGVDRVIRPVDL